VVDQLKRVPAPIATAVDVAEKVSFGGAATASARVWVAVPPAPVHVSVNVLLPRVSPLSVSLPRSPFSPLQLRLARQLRALVVAQEIVTEPSGLTTAVLKVKLSTGGGRTLMLTVCAASPMALTHLSV
jgi:hypothetical protein